MSEEVLTNSLWTLGGLLERHYGRKVILLIDAYDVPLDKAEQYGYYDEMALVIRNLFQQALKGNDSLQFAVFDRMPENFQGEHFYRAEQPEGSLCHGVPFLTSILGLLTPRCAKCWQIMESGTALGR